MKSKVDLYNHAYKNHTDPIYIDIRRETYGEDIGQSSWITVEEYRGFLKNLDLLPGSKVLEIASGSGGPALFMAKETGAQITGLDINENGIQNAHKLAKELNLETQVQFIHGNASEALPFKEQTFDYVISMDSMNHINHRINVLAEWYRVLKKGGKIMYTDTTVVTGSVTFEELAIRSSIGFFLFLPPGENEKMIQAAGFQNIHSKDITGNMAKVSLHWHDARSSRRRPLVIIEGESDFNGLQKFLMTVHTLAIEKRLSRWLFIAEK
ncbi:MAG TPA: class I SAM-dependent methyltransferase [Saprospiraceae bacterium]|nr:class I SAM-dependent methyltransferase [Saprospiraceae bacterium]